MDEYILPEIKQLSGIHESSDAFDRNIILYTNGLFAELNQMHAGPPEGFAISMNSVNTWGEFTQDLVLLGFVKTYIVTKVQLRFNTPASAIVVQEMKDTINEMASRILNITDKPEPIEEETQNECALL